MKQSYSSGYCSGILPLSIVLFIIPIASLQAGGSDEAESSAAHGKYLAGQGIIVPPGSIQETAYIAQIDYNYAPPDSGPFAVHLRSGNRQISNKGQQEVIHIGIKAAKTAFEDLPPLNLAFVIDTSGSMSGDDKLQWVKDSFQIFIERVREEDFVSLVQFSSESQVIFPSTRMESQSKRDLFTAAVEKMESGGETNLTAGLEDGYAQVLANFRGDYSNRVLFLTDGVGDSEGILDMADSYSRLGINVSTIGVGTDFDVNLMAELARRGGGSSRFISDREQMRKTFGDELDRMVVPAARNLSIRLKLPEWARVTDTWGYNHQRAPNHVTYSLPTLHNGDYETILAKIQIDPVNLIGEHTMAEFTVSYENLKGRLEIMETFRIQTEFVPERHPVTGFSDYTVLRSFTMLSIAEAMKRIGDIYYRTQNDISELNHLKNDLLNAKYSNKDSLTDEEAREQFDEITSEEIEILENTIRDAFQSALDRTVETRRMVLNNRKKLDNIGFDDELTIFNRYMEILGEDLELSDERIALLKKDIQPSPAVEQRSLTDRIESMFREISISLRLENQAAVAVAPFVQQPGKSSAFTEILNQSAMNQLSRNTSLRILDREGLDDILREQQLVLAGLVDTKDALRVGRLLAARYMVTGSVIPMKESVIIFARVINVESGELETVAQATVPLTEDIVQLLN